MKKILILFLSVLVLVACGKDSIYDKNNNDNESNNVNAAQEDEVENEEEQQEEKFETKKIDLDEEFSFDQYDINFKQVKVYEKDDKYLADIIFDWTNNYHEYDKSSFFVLSLFDVLQSEQELEEVNDAWNVDNKLESDVLFENAAGGTTQVKLTYELKDVETPLDLIITPTIDEDNPTEFNIEIK